MNTERSERYYPLSAGRFVLPAAGALSGRDREPENCLLTIEELEPRLTPDYLGIGSPGGGNGNGGPPPPGRTIGWGC